MKTLVLSRSSAIFSLVISLIVLPGMLHAERYLKTDSDYSVLEEALKQRSILYIDSAMEDRLAGKSWDEIRTAIDDFKLVDDDVEYEPMPLLSELLASADREIASLLQVEVLQEKNRDLTRMKRDKLQSWLDSKQLSD